MEEEHGRRKVGRRRGRRLCVSLLPESEAY